jgi:hypothetical protein
MGDGDLFAFEAALRDRERWQRLLREQELG